MKTILMPVVVALLLMLFGCKPRVAQEKGVELETQTTDSVAVEKRLVEIYLNGKVSRCKVDGGTIYFGERNAPDAGSEVFDAKGEKLGGCYYSTRQLHPLCQQATDCEDIYRVSPNIWGQPGIPYSTSK